MERQSRATIELPPAPQLVGLGENEKGSEPMNDSEQRSSGIIRSVTDALFQSRRPRRERESADFASLEEPAWDMSRARRHTSGTANDRADYRVWLPAFLTSAPTGLNVGIRFALASVVAAVVVSALVIDRKTVFATSAPPASNSKAGQPNSPPATVADPQPGPRVVIVKTVPVSVAPKGDAAALEAATESSNQQGAEPQTNKAPVQLAATAPKTVSQNVQVAAVGPTPIPSQAPPPERSRSSSDEQQGTKSARNLNSDEAQILLKRGEEYLSSGDFAAARLILKRLADARNARAALMLAGSYDPLILERLNAYAFVADVSQARIWYEKAREFGSPEASQRLELLASVGR